MEDLLERTARDAGADDVGIATVDRLGEHPSMDASYLLPGARSVISVMVAFDPAIVEPYLGKVDRAGLQHHETELYRRLDTIARQVAAVLTSRGHRAAVTEPNLDYRYKGKAGYRRVPPALRQALVDRMSSDGRAPLRPLKRALARSIPSSLLGAGSFRLTPTFAHRYGAVAAGIGALGWSGNVLHPRHGARVLYHSIVTDAGLAPHPMLEETPCDGCRICTRVCQGGYMHPKLEDGVTIGGRRHVHTRKANNLRCIFVCGGLTGQSRYPRWSTWSPGRIQLPDSDGPLSGLWARVARASLGRDNHYSRTLAALQYHSDHGFLHKTEERFDVTCGFCQLVCAPTRDERERLRRIIVDAGSVQAVPPPAV